jgi:amino acid transporter
MKSKRGYSTFNWNCKYCRSMYGYKIKFVCIDQEKWKTIIYEVNRLSIFRKNLFLILFCLLVKHLSEDDLIYSITYLLFSLSRFFFYFILNRWLVSMNVLIQIIGYCLTMIYSRRKEKERERKRRRTKKRAILLSVHIDQTICTSINWYYLWYNCFFFKILFF